MKVNVGKKWEPGAEYIGRPSPLGNPFVMQGSSDRERDRVCDNYQMWFAKQVADKNPAVLTELRRLYRLAQRPQGVILGCFCAPKRCHGDTIAAFLKSFGGV